MSVNKLALIRYKTIDHCLRQRHRKWTLENLMEKIADALYEFEGITSGVSKRTVQGDIQFMRSNKLAYNAPIVVTDRKYYTYSDPNYSINNSPMTDADVRKMKEAVDFLKYMNGFDHFEEMSDLIVRLESNLSKSEGNKKAAIQLESNKLLKGLAWISPLHKAIREEIPLLIRYKSFKSKAETQHVYYPYLLKEYRNRWFLICKQKKGTILITLALDRMLEIEEMTKSGYIPYTGVDFERYFEDTIGVSKTTRDRGNRVILEIDAYHAPYVETKPIHQSQQIISKKEDGSFIIRLDVVLNFELEREILGFGETIKVLAPPRLKNRITNRLKAAIKHYDIENPDN